MQDEKDADEGNERKPQDAVLGCLLSGILAEKFGMISPAEGNRFDLGLDITGDTAQIPAADVAGDLSVARSRESR